MTALIEDSSFIAPGPDVDVGSIAWSRDGALLAVLSPILRRASVVRAVDGKEIASISGFSSCGRTIAFTLEHRVLLPPLDSQTSAFALWDPVSGATSEIPGPEPTIADNRINGLGRFALAANGSCLVGIRQTLRRGSVAAIWDTKTWRYLGGEAYQGLAVGVSPDGRLAALGGVDGTVTIFETASGRILRRTRRHLTPVQNLCFCDGTGVIATIAGQRGFGVNPETGLRGDLKDPVPVEIYDARTDRRISDLGGMPSVDTLDFDAESRLLAIATGDGRLSIWQTGTFIEIAVPAVGLHPGTVLVAFSKTGRKLAIAQTRTGQITIYRW